MSYSFEHHHSSADQDQQEYVYDNESNKAKKNHNRNKQMIEQVEKESLSKTTKNFDSQKQKKIRYVAKQARKDSEDSEDSERAFTKEEIMKLCNEGFVRISKDSLKKIKKDQKEQYSPIPMWYQCPDQQGNLKQAMVYDVKNYFDQFLEVINELRETVYKKWGSEQKQAYSIYLNDIQSYITSYIITGQVTDLNIFYEALETYSANINPLGKKLYDNQIDYLNKIENGHDFILEKKNKKTQSLKPVKNLLTPSNPPPK